MRGGGDFGFLTDLPKKAVGSNSPKGRMAAKRVQEVLDCVKRSVVLEGGECGGGNSDPPEHIWVVLFACLNQ